VPTTSSTNCIYNKQNTSTYGAWGINGSGVVQVNSGTWITGDLGKNGSDNLTGTIEVRGGAISFAGARYLANGTINVSGGVFQSANTNSGMSNGGRFSLGQVGAGPAALWTWRRPMAATPSAR
jgi:hypothetical protein